MPAGAPQKAQFDRKTMKRLLSYMKVYRGQLVFVIVCILISAVASAASSMFLQSLIDNYIVPLLSAPSPVFTGLFRALAAIGVIYLVGVLSTLFYNRVMVTIAQEMLKTIRDEMFEKMQHLPIRVFDTRTHGDIMSLYTNDTDTLRQMIAQSMARTVDFFGFHYCRRVLLYAVYQRLADACRRSRYVHYFANREKDYGKNRRFLH